MKTLKVDFIPHYDIGKIWQFVEGGVVECLEAGRGEHTRETVLRDLVTGQNGLFLGTCDGDLAGFAITQVVPKNFGSELLLFMVWIAPHAGGNFLSEGLPAIEKHGKSLGCDLIVFYSSLTQTRSGKGFADRVGELGFKPHYIEYVRKL